MGLLMILGVSATITLTTAIGVFIYDSYKKFMNLTPEEQERVLRSKAAIYNY